MAQSQVRSFLAIELSEALKNEVYRFIESIQTKYPAFRFVPPQNWHLTLHFLGQVETKRIEELSVKASRALEKVTPFSIFLKGLGAFPNWNRPHTLWVGVGGDTQQLSALKKRLDQVLQEAHFQIEVRTYHPHITIARLKGGASFLQSTPTCEFQSRTVDQIRCVTLFKSDLSPQGACHTPLKIFQFQSS